MLLGSLCLGTLCGCARASLLLEKDGGPLGRTNDASTEVDAEVEPDASDGPTDQDQDAGRRDAGSKAEPDSSIVEEPSTCFAGVYTGTFEGEIKVLGFISLPIEGEIAITVATSDSGDSLTIEDGEIMGEDQDGNPIQAEVSGSMNCVTNRLENGKLLNGVYTRTGLGMTVEFEGTADATYEPGDQPSLSGTWKTNGGPIEQGMGTFGAKFQLP